MLNIPSSSANSLAVSCQARFCLPKPRTPIPNRHGGVTLCPPDCSHHTAHQVGEPKLEKKSSECSSWSNCLPFTRYTKLKSSNAPSFGVTCFSASSGAAGCLLHTSVPSGAHSCPVVLKAAGIWCVASFTPAPDYLPPMNCVAQVP